MQRLGNAKVHSYLGFYVPLEENYWKGECELAYVDMRQLGTVIEVISNDKFRLWRKHKLLDYKMRYSSNSIKDANSLRYNFRKPYRNEVALLKFD